MRSRGFLRRVRDSNPGARCRAYGFQDRRFRPLSQLSACEKPLFDGLFRRSPGFDLRADLLHGGHSVAMRFSRRPGIESGVDVRNRGLLHSGDQVTVDSEGDVPR